MEVSVRIWIRYKASESAAGATVPSCPSGVANVSAVDLTPRPGVVTKYLRARTIPAGSRRQLPQARRQYILTNSQSQERDNGTMKSMYLVMFLCVALVNAEDSGTGSGSGPAGTPPPSSNGGATGEVCHGVYSLVVFLLLETTSHVNQKNSNVKS